MFIPYENYISLKPKMEKSTREVNTCQNFQNQCLAAARYAAISLGTTGAGEFKLPSGNGLPF